LTNFSNLDGDLKIIKLAYVKFKFKAIIYSTLSVISIAVARS